MSTGSSEGHQKSYTSSWEVKTISINLHTSDRAVAINKRDLILGEWAALSSTKRSPDIYAKKLADLDGQDLTNSEAHVPEPVLDAVSISGAQTQDEAVDALRDFSAADRAAFLGMASGHQVRDTARGICLLDPGRAGCSYSAQAGND